MRMIGVCSEVRLRPLRRLKNRAGVGSLGSLRKNPAQLAAVLQESGAGVGNSLIFGLAEPSRAFSEWAYHAP
jgi:hypothetical protein